MASRYVFQFPTDAVLVRGSDPPIEIQYPSIEFEDGVMTAVWFQDGIERVSGVDMILEDLPDRFRWKGEGTGELEFRKGKK